jgi:hypothetical protein
VGFCELISFQGLPDSDLATVAALILDQDCSGKGKKETRQDIAASGIAVLRPSVSGTLPCA